MTRALLEALLTTVTLPVALPAVVGAKSTANVAVLPAATEIPGETPVTLNPGPEAVIVATDKAAEPVFSRVTVRDALLPMGTFPNATLAGEAVIPIVTPEPVITRFIAASEALLLVNAMFPVALPAAVGANWAVNVELWPAVNMIGVEMPVTVKPGPVVMACDTVIVAEPEFVRVIVALPVLPTLTFPKLTAEGDAVSVP